MALIKDDDKRGTTSRQMRDAPQGALYLIHNRRALRWFEELAQSIGREDLKFDVVSILARPDLLYGMDRTQAVVVDHWAAARLDPNERVGAAWIEARGQT